MGSDVNTPPEPYVQTYEDKVGQMLIDMRIGGILVLSKYVKPENNARFIEVVKSYIERNMGHSDGWDIGFNNNYTKIKKQCKNNLKKENEYD